MKNYVHVQKINQSQPIIYENVIDTYEKGSFYCIYVEGEIVYREPLALIWRIKESYGYHGREEAK